MASPLAALLAAVDNAKRIAVRNGRDLVDNPMGYLEKLRDNLDNFNKGQVAEGRPSGLGMRKLTSDEQTRQMTQGALDNIGGGYAQGGLVGIDRYGPRYNSMGVKGRGYFGPLKGKLGISSEISTEDESGEYPLLVPTLNREEVERLLNGEEPNEEIYRKAREHADVRRSSGESPYADEQGLHTPLPKYSQGGLVQSEEARLPFTTLDGIITNYSC